MPIMKPLAKPPYLFLDNAPKFTIIQKGLGTPGATPFGEDNSLHQVPNLLALSGKPRLRIHL